MFNIFKKKEELFDIRPPMLIFDRSLPMVIPQPEEEPILLTDEVLPDGGGINADYNNSWSMLHCGAIECPKMQFGCCIAYRDPTVLSWFRHGEECPTGPYQRKFVKATKVNPLKASKRRNPLWQNSWSLKTRLGSRWPPG